MSYYDVNYKPGNSTSRSYDGKGAERIICSMSATNVVELMFFSQNEALSRRWWRWNLISSHQKIIQKSLPTDCTDTTPKISIGKFRREKCAIISHWRRRSRVYVYVWQISLKVTTYIHTTQKISYTHLITFIAPQLTLR